MIKVNDGKGYRPFQWIVSAERSKVGADGATKERIWSGICYPVEDIIPMPIFIYNSAANINIFNYIK
ncbi:hypothetical protein DW010_12540 [Bacteroides stercoris]|nr:hypothetical protein DW010_12540 [Bacteroides stercoris]